MGPTEEQISNYINQYPERQRIYRLQYIAKTALQQRTDATAAIAATIAEFKKGVNTSGYRQFITFLVDNQVAVELDDAWIAAADKRGPELLDKLEVTLGTAKTNLVKETVRIASNDLADYYRSRNDLQSAIKHYTRSKDYCLNAVHQANMHLCIAEACLLFERHSFAHQYAGRAKVFVGGATPSEITRCAVAEALCGLDRKNYRDVAKHLEYATDDEASSILMRPYDVALLLGVCSIAACDRSEVNRLMELPSFRRQIELDPQINTMVLNFHQCQYSASLATAHQLLQDAVALDMYIGPVAMSLYETLVSKALRQYAAPFVAVDMNKMATAFELSLEDLERRLSDLIQRDTLAARIDRSDAVLHSTQANHRSITTGNVHKTGQRFCEEAEDALRRISMNRHRFVVQRPRQKQRESRADEMGFFKKRLFSS